MQSGINKTDIKFKSGSLFVKGIRKKHDLVYYSVDSNCPLATMVTTAAPNSN